MNWNPNTLSFSMNRKKKLGVKFPRTVNIFRACNVRFPCVNDIKFDRWVAGDFTTKFSFLDARTLKAGVDVMRSMILTNDHRYVDYMFVIIFWQPAALTDMLRYSYTSCKGILVY